MTHSEEDTRLQVLKRAVCKLPDSVYPQVMRVFVSSKEITFSNLELDDVILCTTVRNMIYSGHTEHLGEEKRGRD